MHIFRRWTVLFNGKYHLMWDYLQRPKLFYVQVRCSLQLDWISSGSRLCACDMDWTGSGPASRGFGMGWFTSNASVLCQRHVSELSPPGGSGFDTGSVDSHAAADVAEAARPWPRSPDLRPTPRTALKGGSGAAVPSRRMKTSAGRVAGRVVVLDRRGGMS